MCADGEPADLDDQILREEIAACRNGERSGGDHGHGPEPATAEGMDAAAILEALVAEQGRIDPYPLYARARELGPVAAVAENLFLVSGYTAVNRVLRNPRFSIVGPSNGSVTDNALAGLNQSILRTNAPEHGRMRSLIGSVFTSRRIMALRPMIEASVDKLLDGLAAAGANGDPVDFMEEFAFQLPVSVICALLGVPQSDRRRFRTLAADLTVALELTIDASDLEPADAAARELADYFRKLTANRRETPRDDLTSALVAARDADDGRLSDLELIANLVVLLVAGFETTTNLLGNGLEILFQHPDLVSPLRLGDLSVPGFVEEILRYDSPVQATLRTARADGLDVAGLPIPKDSMVVLLIGAANRDPDRYPAPDRFDPTRTDIAPLSFGAGAHICLGNNLARLEAAIAFSRLLSRFPQVTPAGRPDRRDRLVLRGLDTLPVTITTPR
jgi:cytochrome P450